MTERLPTTRGRKGPVEEEKRTLPGGEEERERREGETREEEREKERRGGVGKNWRYRSKK
jgi:hypothetical protein